MSSRDIKLSKALSWILRHGALKLGLTLDPEGFIPVKTLLAQPQLRGFSFGDVERIVAANEKQRFTLKTDLSNSGILLIRANQGHSLQVENLELQEITSADKYPTVVHGTYKKCWDSIKTNGLSKMTRTHIHFAPGLPKEEQVISGMRTNCDMLIYIDLKQALLDGFKFYKSTNNVILCPGNKAGFLPRKYFSKVDTK